MGCELILQYEVQSRIWSACTFCQVPSDHMYRLTKFVFEHDSLQRCFSLIRTSLHSRMEFRNRIRARFLAMFLSAAVSASPVVALEFSSDLLGVYAAALCVACCLALP